MVRHHRDRFRISRSTSMGCQRSFFVRQSRSGTWLLSGMPSIDREPTNWLQRGLDSVVSNLPVRYAITYRLCMRRG